MMQIKFTGHSGLAISDGHQTIMIDPWFYSSTLETPVLQGVLPPNQTIDFQIPEPKDQVKDFKPDAIFVSHFHTHHSPLKEIRELSQKNKNCVLGFPKISKDISQKIQQALGAECEHVQMLPLENQSETKIGSLKIRALTHTADGHLAYFIESPSGSVLHLTDAKMNLATNDKRMDALWKPYKSLSPDILFIASGGHTLKFFSQGKPGLALETTLTPLEAARVTSWIDPKVACIFGLFNQSIWKNQLEFVLPSHVVEEQYAWALQHMSPQIRTLPIRPGFCFEVEKSEIKLNLLKS